MIRFLSGNAEAKIQPLKRMEKHMFSSSQKSSLTNALTTLQNRIASGLRSSSSSNHAVLVSVSISDMSGNVLDTIETSGKTSSWNAGSVSSLSQFATGITLDTHTKRVAAMFEVAAYVYSLANDTGCVVSATFQDNTNGTTMDYVAQAFFKDGKGLTIKEVDVRDNS